MKSRSAKAAAAAVASALLMASAVAVLARDRVHRPMSDLKPEAVIALGKTADWVAIAPDAVWVGSTGPNAVHRIDPRSNARVATVALDGEPCAGLAIGAGSLWVPLCGESPALAKIDPASNRLTASFKVEGVIAEGGVTASDDSVWLVVDKNATLARIDPATGDLRQKVHVPPGSYNPRFADGIVWVTRADGAEITAVDAKTGEIRASVRTGPGPRFLTAGAGAIWTLDQGDGTLTRIDASATHATKIVALGTPGHGGDIAFGAGMIWTTMMKTPLSMIDAQTATLRCQWAGAGGDSLGIGHRAIWLTDYHGGTLSRFDLDSTVDACANVHGDASTPSQTNRAHR
jgi:virginiamycin B lyase